MQLSTVQAYLIDPGRQTAVTAHMNAITTIVSTKIFSLSPHLSGAESAPGVIIIVIYQRRFRANDERITQNTDRCSTDMTESSTADAANQDATDPEEAIDRLVQAGVYKRCPGCGILTERISGCAYLECAAVVERLPSIRPEAQLTIFRDDR